MMYFPEWWFILSGIFFGLASIVFLILAFMLVRHFRVLAAMLEDTHRIIKKIDLLADKTDDSLREIKDITRNMNRFSYAVTERFVEAGNRVSQSAQKASFAFLGFTTLRKIVSLIQLFKHK